MNSAQFCTGLEVRVGSIQNIDDIRALFDRNHEAWKTIRFVRSLFILFHEIALYLWASRNNLASLCENRMQNGGNDADFCGKR